MLTYGLAIFSSYITGIIFKPVALFVPGKPASRNVLNLYFSFPRGLKFFNLLEWHQPYTQKVSATDLPCPAGGYACLVLNFVYRSSAVPWAGLFIRQSRSKVFNVRPGRSVIVTGRL
jgi:hypothetical protein